MIKFPTELKEWKYIIERKAKRAGLDFFTTIFEMVDFDQMNELAAYSGFPTRWSHWQFGQEYEYLKKFYTYGLQKIYEMVINNDPCYAYLLEANSITDHKMVIAHVYGHNDFFKNNIWFSPVPRNMIDELGNHRYQIEEIKEKIGEEEVDNFLDKILSLEWLIDDHSLMIRRAPKRSQEEEKEKPHRLGSSQTPYYLDEWLNPLEYLKEKEAEIKEKKEEAKLVEKGLKIPLKPTRDILLFLIEHAPLEQWQKQIISIIREESYYFVPQIQTKIMNEGWATYWHSKIMMEMGACEEKEIIDCADHTSGTLQGFPYKMGYEIFLDIEYRWNTNRHGEIWEECEIQEIKENWDEFIVFKSFYDEFKEDCEQISKKWTEFCTFINALQNGECGFPKELFSKRTLVERWVDYQNAQVLIAQQKEYLKEAKESWAKALKRLAKDRKETDNEEKKKAMEKQYQTRSKLAKKDIKEIYGNLNYLRTLETIKEAIGKKSLAPVSKNIPKSYFEFASRYPEPVKLGVGREKIFEVRKFYNDVTFLEEFLTEEICAKMQLFTFEPGGGGVEPSHYGIVSRLCEKVKKKLLFQITHRGQPIIELIDANFENRGELYLKHIHEGMDLHLPMMKDVMKILYELWQKSIHLETIITQDKESSYLEWIRKQMRQNPYQLEIEYEEPEKLKGKKMLFTYDGKELKENKMEDVLVDDPF
jgi:stage V sporulation protein R